MSSNDSPLEPSTRAGALLSAYLDGELGADEDAALEAQLQTDQAMARRLDAIADTLVELRGLDEVDVPDGFAQRLSDRLAPDTKADAPVDDLSARRARRAAGRGISWAAISGVAAALVAVAVITIGDLPGSRDAETADMALEAFEDPAGGAGQGAAGPEAAVPEAAPDAAAGSDTRQELRASGTEESASGGAPASAATGQPAAALPALVDAGRVVADAAELEATFSGLPEATDLLGLSLPLAQERAAANIVAIRQAGPLPNSGLVPSACLDTVTPGAGPVVPVRVESLRYEGEQALAYVGVSARTGSAALDQVQTWVIDPATCATRELLTLPTG